MKELLSGNEAIARGAYDLAILPFTSRFLVMSTEN